MLVYLSNTNTGGAPAFTKTFLPSSGQWATPYLVLMTEHGTGEGVFLESATVNLTVRAKRTVANGGYIETITQASGAAFTQTVTFGNTGHVHRHDGVWYSLWYIPLSGFAGLMDILTGGSAMSFGNLQYDLLTFNVSGTYTLKPIEGGKTITIEYATPPRISRQPVFTFSAVNLDTPTALEFDYTATAGWDRNDDDLVVRPVSVNGIDVARAKPFVRRNRSGYAYGSLAVSIPEWIGSPVPAVGDEVAFEVWYSDYATLTLEQLGSYTLTIGNAIECDTPDVATVVSADATFDVTCTKSGDRSYQGDELYSVMLAGGYPCDTVETAEGGTAVLYPPLDVDFTVYVTGYSDDGDISAQETATGRVASNGNLYIDDMQGSSITLRYNQEFADDRTADMELVKLARPLPSAFFGTGCSEANVNVQGTVLKSEQDADAFRALAGTVQLLRYPGGDRRLVAIRSVSIRTLPAYWSVTLSCTEVSA